MSKIKDGIYGFVIGDAMGVPNEFKDRSELIKNPLTKMIGYGSHPVPEGTWSDDTSMTLALMKSIADKKVIDYNDIMNNFLRWFNNGEFTTDGEVFDIGRTCLQAIRNYSNGISPTECGLKDSFSNGNGSLMRILPLAYYFYYEDITNESEIVKLVNDVSSFTHAHEISKLGCYIYVRYVINLLLGYSKEESYELIQKLDYSKYYSKETIDRYNRILKNDISKYYLEDIKSSGYIIDTLEAVLYSLLNTKKFKDSIIVAINLGDDTDTVGAITGSLAGIIYGFNEIPSKWVNKLRSTKYLNSIINDFSMTLGEDID